LLGILDKAILRLGDNNVVNFERCLIFLTSNLGAQSMMKELGPAFGFGDNRQASKQQQAGRLESLAMSAARRHFSPEFVNRLDAAITYQPLSEESLKRILDLELENLQRHILHRLGERAFTLHVPCKAKAFILREGTSSQYGAREIKRTIHRHLTQPLAALVSEGAIAPRGRVVASYVEEESKIVLKPAA
jgi:ATP-dependent Clp protease ATP-binding subunit ClpA